MNNRFYTFWKRWLREDEGIAALEAGYIFPILMTLLLSVFDLGNAIIANQKTIRASQVVGDLVTRVRNITDAGVDEAVMAGGLALVPLNDTTYGVDIISIRFVEDDEMEIVWRETRNMDQIEDLETRVAPLAEEGNGVVVVAVEYIFEPVFAGFVVEQVPMQEIAFTRGRRSAVVCREGAETC